MSKNFEILNKELDENNIKASLVIFPFAGGGVSAFRKWADKFDDTRLYVAQYPGRENRFSEKAISDINVLVEELFNDMKENFDFEKPYFLFGHSMGTKIVYELALRIKKSDYVNPRGIIISAGRAPLYKEPNPIYHLNDEGFIEGLRRYEGTPKEILDNKELISIFLPTLRADFVIDEDYKDTKHEKLESPILGLMGDKDQEMKLEELKKWQDYTTKEFVYKYIDGKHMFVNTSTEMVIREIKSYINENVKNN
ncbi:thioesterase [Anaerococcus sp. WCA-380-WT-2B]|uniref:Thioesterase n=1 Tax=Anaerococcus porci TaxID=2652269 RepID=A0A6N7VUQ8_9FIRM|nr:thioesterase domain-containing protein [Anaerococcus porci]MSS78586.1 thioesterase [Anaerococcus porci]